MKFKALFIASAIIPIILGGLYYYLTQMDLLGGKTEIRGAYEDIDIYSMDKSIKIVDAKTYLGSLYGLGFIHARDRLW